MEPVMTPSDEPTLSPRLTVLFAAACGLIVANIYYAQPLIAPMYLTKSIHEVVAAMRRELGPAMEAMMKRVNEELAKIDQQIQAALAGTSPARVDPGLAQRVDTLERFVHEYLGDVDYSQFEQDPPRSMTYDPATRPARGGRGNG